MSSNIFRLHGVWGRGATLLILTTLLTMTFIWAAKPASAGDWREDSCASKVVKDQYQNIAWIEHRGTKRDNVCFGTKYQDIFWTGAGNDRVRSYDGPDKIHLAGGHDIAYAGDGDDTIWTGSGEDIAYGGNGRDYFSEKTLRGGSDWDCYIAGPGKDNGYIQDGDDIVMDDYWGGKGTNDLYPQIDSFCDSGGGCVQDDVYQVEDGPCRHDPNADCTSPGKPKDICKNAATRT